jgi:hypothetical protein
VTGFATSGRPVLRPPLTDLDSPTLPIAHAPRAPLGATLQLMPHALVREWGQCEDFKEDHSALRSASRGRCRHVSQARADTYATAMRSAITVTEIYVWPGTDVQYIFDQLHYPPGISAMELRARGGHTRYAELGDPLCR